LSLFQSSQTKNENNLNSSAHQDTVSDESVDQQSKKELNEKSIVLSTDDLSRRFANETKPVFSNVEFEVHDGECVAILGLSGAGKTTLFNVLAGLDQPDTGQIQLEKQLGYMFQKDLLMPWKRVIDNVSLPLVLKGVNKKTAHKEAKQHFPAFGLSGLEQRYPNEISGGERRRASLLRTYLTGSEILLLDEPFTGVDAVTRVDLQEWLRNLVNTKNLTLVLITHDLDEAIRLADRIYVLQIGTPSQLSESIEVNSASKKTIFTRLMDLLYKKID